MKNLPIYIRYKEAARRSTALISLRSTGISLRSTAIAAGLLCLTLAACDPSEAIDVPAPTAPDALVATAALPAATASGTLTRSTRALPPDSKLSALTLWYPAAQPAEGSTEGLTAYPVPGDFITLGTEGSNPTLSFVTAKTGAATPAPLYWSQIQGEGATQQTFYLTVKRNEDLSANAAAASPALTTLWGKYQMTADDGHRQPLQFGTLKNRLARLTVVVNPGGGRPDFGHLSNIEVSLYAVPCAAEAVATDATHITSLPWPRAKKDGGSNPDGTSDADPQKVVLISSSAPSEGSKVLSGSIYLAPQPVPTGGDGRQQLLSISYTYRGQAKTVTKDLTDLSVNRATGSEFANGYTDPGNGIYTTGTAFAYNANEHLRLTLSLVVNDALTPGTVTVEELTDASNADGNNQGWDQESYEIETDADGQKTYVVYNAAGLQAFADAVNNATTDEGRALNCRLEADITLPALSNPDTESNWTPIGTHDKPYTGTFDGNGYTVSGLVINRESTSYQGFFGYIDAYSKPATVKNLTVEGKVTGKYYTGGIVGCSLLGNRVESCVSRVEVKGDDFVGGIAGSNHVATITACTNTGSVTGTGNIGAIGGIAGYNSGSTITASTNTGSVMGTSDKNYVGGVAGYNNSSATIIACTNTGSVMNMGSNTGGITGYNINNATITACINTGSVTSTGSVTGIDYYTGGVVGSTLNNATITACYWQTFGTGHRPTEGVGNNKSHSGTTKIATASAWSSSALTGLNTAIGTWNNDHADDGLACPYEFYANTSYDGATNADTTVPPLLLRKKGTTPP